MEGKLQKTTRQFSGVLTIYNIVSLVPKKEVFREESLKILGKSQGLGRIPDFLGITGNNP